MENTALCADNNAIIFISETHEKFFKNLIHMVRRNDVYHRALIYCLGINADTREHIDDIYDFNRDCIKTHCLHEAWQTSGSQKVVRLAFNLFCDGTPSVRDWEDSEEKLDECKMYTVDDIFCCSYAPFFWQAIQMRYPEYATYYRRLNNLFGGSD